MIEIFIKKILFFSRMLEIYSHPISPKGNYYLVDCATSCVIGFDLVAFVTKESFIAFNDCV